MSGKAGGGGELEKDGKDRIHKWEEQVSCKSQISGFHMKKRVVDKGEEGRGTREIFQSLISPC